MDLKLTIILLVICLTTVKCGNRPWPPTNAAYMKEHPDENVSNCGGFLSDMIQFVCEENGGHRGHDNRRSEGSLASDCCEGSGCSYNHLKGYCANP